MASQWSNGAARSIRNIILIVGGLLIGGAATWAITSTPDFDVSSAVAVSYDTVHRSFFLAPDVYDRGYADAQGTVKLDTVSAGIVPHHLLANHQLADFFTALGNDQQYDIVVLIGPDHQDRSRYRIATSRAAWDTPYGTVAPGTRVIDALVQQGAADVDETIFSVEHSITGLVPFIRHSLPQARIVPITIQSQASDASIDALAAALHDVLPARSLVLASVDFAHYVPHEEAMRQNEANITLLERMDPDGTGDLYVDSPQTVRTVLQYLQDRGDPDYQLITSTDSAEVVGQLDLTEVTSYITMYFGKR